MKSWIELSWTVGDLATDGQQSSWAKVSPTVGCAISLLWASKCRLPTVGWTGSESTTVGRGPSWSSPSPEMLSPSLGWQRLTEPAQRPVVFAISDPPQTTGRTAGHAVSSCSSATNPDAQDVYGRALCSDISGSMTKSGCSVATRHGEEHSGPSVSAT